MRARVSDPSGPPWLVAVTRLGALAPAALALLVGSSLTVAATLAMLAVGWSFVARRVLPALPAREARVEIGRGGLRVVGAGVASRVLAAGDVVGASAAPGRAGTGELALVVGSSGSRPFVLEVDAADAPRLRRALGIGARGLGEIAWGAAPSLLWRSALGLLGWGALAAATACDAIDLAAWLALVIVPLSLWDGASRMAGAGRRASVTLGRDEVRLAGQAPLRLAEILGAEATGRLLRVDTTGGPRHARLSGTTPEERAQAAAHIRCAAERERARPAGASAADGPLAALSRTPGEDRARWLARLDALAVSVGEACGGYRGAEVDAAELWDALEDPDVAPPVRAAAARLLARAAPDEARTRVADALAVERDGHTRAQIRVALEDDVELAARELERLADDGA